MKDTTSEMKTAQDGINDRLVFEELKINEFEDIPMETIQNETHREREKRI